MFQAVHTNKLGYKLVDKGDGKWQIVSPQGIFTGNMKQVCTYSVLELGFEMNELELGIMEMEKQFHNAAEYGVFKKFIYSYDQEERNETFNTKH